MAKRRAGVDTAKLLHELIRVLHAEDSIGTAQVVEMFVNAGGDEEQALELLEESADGDEFDFEGDDESYDDDDDI